MLLQGALTVLLLINCVSLSSQGCGSTSCSQDYDAVCPQDESCHIYDNCMTSQSGCNEAMGPADSLKVDCYDTCIEGSPWDPTIPLQCCADSIVSSDAMSTTNGQGYLIARLYSPNEAGLGIYRHNTFCKYNVQCPDENFDLHYLMVRFNIEQPDANGKCLDLLRYHFTATGTTVDSDACGDLEQLPSSQKSGAHGSSLTVDFRSNRINRNIDFFLAVTCVDTGGAARRKRATALAETSLLSNQVKVRPTLDPNLNECSPSLSLNNNIVRNLAKEDTSDEEYLVKVFPKEIQKNGGYSTITITRSDVIKYRNNILYLKHEGKTIRIFRNVKVLYLYNSIEGHVTFRRNSSPARRNFPGHGILQVRRGTALYYQTIIDPRYLLNEGEVTIVRELYKELLSRHVLDNERFYFTPPDLTLMDDNSERVNCSINELAEMNSRSCTDVVRAAANFFLQEDTYQDFCYKKTLMADND